MIIDGTITRLRWAYINSADIDRVEVIKGAAATHCMARTGHGVIQIFTKRGATL